MSDTPKVELALSPAEWDLRDRGVLGVLIAVHTDGTVIDMTATHIGVHSRSVEMAVEMARPMAVAALALYGQPFGPTPDEVRTFATVVEIAGEDWAMLGQPGRDRLTRLRSLLAKLRALLPPPEDT